MPTGSKWRTARRRRPWQQVPTGAEVDPDALLAALVRAASDAIARAPEGRVAGIGVTSVAETGMLMDAAGRVLHRAHRLARRARGGRGASARARPARLPERTGLPASALCSLAKLRHSARAERRAG